MWCILFECHDSASLRSPCFFVVLSLSCLFSEVLLSSEAQVDYDVCSNYGNWLYSAGVGNDPRENRKFNMIKQALDYDGHVSALQNKRLFYCDACVVQRKVLSAETKSPNCWI